MAITHDKEIELSCKKFKEEECKICLLYENCGQKSVKQNYCPQLILPRKTEDEKDDYDNYDDYESHIECVPKGRKVSEYDCANCENPEWCDE